MIYSEGEISSSNSSFSCSSRASTPPVSPRCSSEHFAPTQFPPLSLPHTTSSSSSPSFTATTRNSDYSHMAKTLLLFHQSQFQCKCGTTSDRKQKQQQQQQQANQEGAIHSPFSGMPLGVLTCPHELAALTLVFTVTILPSGAVVRSEMSSLLASFVHHVGALYPSLLEEYVGTTCDESNITRAQQGCAMDITVVAWTLSRRSCRKLKRLVQHYLERTVEGVALLPLPRGTGSVSLRSAQVKRVPIDAIAVLAAPNERTRKRKRSAAHSSSDQYDEDRAVSRCRRSSSVMSRRSSPSICSSFAVAPLPRRRRSPSAPSPKESERSIVAALGDRLLSDTSLNVLGEGNNGVVFEAQLQGLGPVAAKLVNAGSLHVKREVATLRRVQEVRCSAMVQLLDLKQLQDDKLLMLLLEKLEKDVWYLSDHSILYPEEIAAVGVAMLDALHALHASCGILHKSVKPENFCFAAAMPAGTEEGQDASPAAVLKLIDFGRSVPLCPVTQQDAEIPFPPSSGAEQQQEEEYPVEERYTGWWFSLAALLGRRQGREDDLLSVLYSIGFLLDDAFRELARDSEKETHEEKEEAQQLHEGGGGSSGAGAEWGADGIATRESSVSTSATVGSSSFVDCRHQLVDDLDDLFAQAKREVVEVHLRQAMQRLTGNRVRNGNYSSGGRNASKEEEEEESIFWAGRRGWGSVSAYIPGPWQARHDAIQQALWKAVEPNLPAEDDATYFPGASLPSWWHSCLKEAVQLVTEIRNGRTMPFVVRREGEGKGAAPNSSNSNNGSSSAALCDRLYHLLRSHFVAAAGGEEKVQESLVVLRGLCSSSKTTQ